MHLEFFGAAGEVTGSCHILHVGSQTLLLDCGMIQGGRAHALLRVDNLLHDVKVGDWIGQNYGRITKITEQEVTLNETVQDATGEWIERTSTLQLQEKAR